MVWPSLGSRTAKEQNGTEQWRRTDGQTEQAAVVGLVTVCRVGGAAVVDGAVQ